ncbi:hypothetical protein ARMGADRAFT_1021930 [Armillaria gallica]|uniref:Uncharacterized protein n=1 Tax=Armillaria gallica TaxID=47427 RepID=A0A2H3ERN6_ARMGA|nr:hypothetical protein ARMGADRAFT_1021930 [Armillaria gallica]
MVFRTFAVFSLFSWAAAVANPLASGDFWTSIEDLRGPADSIYRDSTLLRIQPTAASANTLLNDVTAFNSEVQAALTQIPATVMSEEDADSTYRTFLDIYEDTRSAFNALNEAESYLEPFGLVPTICGLTQSIQTGLHTLVNETLAVTPEDYVSPIQTVTGPILDAVDSAINFYC